MWRRQWRRMLAVLGFIGVAASGCSQAYELAFQPEVGQARSVYYEANVAMNSEEMGGMSATIVIEAAYTMEPVNTTGLGDVVLDVTVERAHMDIFATVMGMDLVTMMRQFGGEDIRPDLSPLAGEKIELTVAPAGEVVRVSGIDQVLDSVVDKLKLEGRERVQRRQMLANILTEEQVKQHFEEMFSKYPARSIRSGSKWSETTIGGAEFAMGGGGGELTTTQRFTAGSPEGGRMRVEWTAELESSSASAVTATGKGRGAIVYGLADGWIHEHTATYDIDTKMDLAAMSGMPNLGGGGQDMVMPMTVKANVKVSSYPRSGA